MIGDTTVLITGLRGNGKTLKAVGMMKAEIAEGRPTFASNFTGLRVAGIQLLDDPRDWESLPPGSILFVDEAQKFWRTRRSGEPGPEVQAMETQRHSGITIVLLTQQPGYLDKHIRGLVDRHMHLVRRAGFNASQVYEWNRVRDDPVDTASIEAAEHSIFAFPKADFADYDSAEVHTIKPRIPGRAKLLVVALVVVAGLFWFALSKFDTGDDAAVDEASVVASNGPSSSFAGAGRSRGVQYATGEQYAAAFNPRVPEVVWTAPAYDGREVVSDPHVYCIASGADGIDGCQCMTEQGTRYALDLDKCLDNARFGEPYNPFKVPVGLRDRTRGRGAGDSPAAMGPDGPAGESPIVAAGSQIPAYGGFRP